MYNEYEYYNDNFDHTSKYILDPILTLLDNRKDLVILDLGCGNGSLVNYLLKLGYNAYGADASISGIQIANKINSGRFIHFDFEKDNPKVLKELKVDVILSIEVIEHLYSAKNFMKLCNQVLENSKTSELILSTPYHGYFKNLILSIFDKWDKHWSPTWEGGHIKFWSKRTIIELFTNNGFKFSSFIGVGRFPYVWKSMIIKGVKNA